jgi:GT2 family glycosyltransferase
MPDEEAPPVVAVVVACDPGPWFEECLDAIGSQDYPNLSVLVVDVASDEDLAPRVASVLPQAFIRRLDTRQGFGPSANIALEAVEGASLLVVCHDDVAPDPDAVRKMVEEAFRSNAGVVAPKLVSWHEPDRLLQVGLGADRFGAPVPRVEPGEIDQSQQDEVREVFAAPGGFTLVRADLFRTLRGFDNQIELFGEDIDLGWRARIAGARVVVAPAARVRHLEATASGMRERPDKRQLQRRHELRAALKNFSASSRLVVVPRLVVLAVGEWVYCLATRDRAHAHEITEAWRWNLARDRHLRAARRRVSRSRRVPDRVVSRLQDKSSVRLRRFARRRIEEGSGKGGGGEPAGGYSLLGADHQSGDLELDLGPGLSGALAVRTARMRRRRAPGGAGDAGDATRSPARPAGREAVVVVVIVLLVLLVGVRDLLAPKLPLVGGLAPFPSATSLLGDYFGGWQAGGAQHVGPAPPAFALLGSAGILLVGAMGLLQKIILFGSILAGAIGAGRLLKPFGSGRARLVAAVVYLAIPLAWDDLSRGDLPGLVVYGAMPFVLARLARAMRVEPFVTAPDRGLWSEILALGALLAVVGSYAPAIFIVELSCAAALVLGSLVAGDLGPTRRLAAVALGGAAAGVVLLLPWSLSFVESGARWSVLSGALGEPARSPALAALMRFDVGPIGSGILGWAFLAAAMLPLLIGRSGRLRWATRWWAVAFGSFALAWTGADGRLGAGGGATGVFLAPAAVAVAACVALGVVAFERDLARFRFGWRQLATAAAAVCVAAGLLPVLTGTLGGRFSLPVTGYDQVLSWMDGKTPPKVPYRVLWLGDPGGVPLRGWQVTPGFEAAISVDGLPDATAMFPPASPGAVKTMITDVELARGGQVADLGQLLAPLGVRYVVVPASNVPALAGVQAATSLPPPPDLVAGLVTQEDLSQLPTEGGSYVFANAAWVTGDGRLPLPGAAASAIGPVPAGVGAAGELVLWLLAAYCLVHARRRRRVEPGPACEPQPQPALEAAVAPEADLPPEAEAELALLAGTLRAAGADLVGEQADT